MVSRSSWMRWARGARFSRRALAVRMSGMDVWPLSTPAVSAAANAVVDPAGKMDRWSQRRGACVKATAEVPDIGREAAAVSDPLSEGSVAAPRGRLQIRPREKSEVDHGEVLQDMGRFLGGPRLAFLDGPGFLENAFDALLRILAAILAESDDGTVSFPAALHGRRGCCRGGQLLGLLQLLEGLGRGQGIILPGKNACLQQLIQIGQLVLEAVQRTLDVLPDLGGLVPQPHEIVEALATLGRLRVREDRRQGSATQHNHLAEPGRRVEGEELRHAVDQLVDLEDDGGDAIGDLRQELRRLIGQGPEQLGEATHLLGEIVEGLDQHGRNGRDGHREGVFDAGKGLVQLIEGLGALAGGLDVGLIEDEAAALGLLLELLEALLALLDQVQDGTDALAEDRERG